MTWVMLNPSTATEEVLDPTVTRCVKRAKAEGCGACVVVNLFAYRATDPKVLRQVVDPVGQGNNGAILAACRKSKQVVVAWGKHGTLTGRSAEVVEMLRSEGIRLLCVGTNNDGTPKHPLYVPMFAGLKDFEGRF